MNSPTILVDHFVSWLPFFFIKTLNHYHAAIDGPVHVLSADQYGLGKRWHWYTSFEIVVLVRIKMSLV
jgi:hypothetical protein